MNITRFVKNNTVQFSRLRHGIAYYMIKDTESEQVYQFPVNLEDINDATLEATDKAIMFMRYIRKAMEDNTFVAV